MSSGDDHFIRPDNDIDIVERLSFDADRCQTSYSTGIAKNIREGIAKIEHLRASLEEVHADRTRCLADVQRLVHANTEVGAHNAMLADENERLRGVMKSLLDVPLRERHTDPVVREARELLASGLLGPKEGE